ncbi:hypothetical protein SPBR_04720 [Sporothrix brasiliensis 5110]|uniref:Phospholipid-binding protein n=1 Tax=Sporothrix brasiliensis 5110 TaxID=1398154 RepID=A0A0C2F8N6_9PEZI|nr:uncharacterized protein SPBR_04720 [Sporothrix brasiliensis 5110]KIH87428.1 hypothetical protein SPBR_04720 [Sporothrix brasiliensis 5110]
MPSSPATPATAGLSAAKPPSVYSVTKSPSTGPHSGAGPSAYSSGYSSFPSAAQSPPTTASTMRPSLSGLAPGSSTPFAPVAPPPPRQAFAFSHDDTDRSRLAYETLSASAKAYRVALGQVSAAASNFGSALEACARLKEARAQPYPPGPSARGGGGSSIGGAGLLSSGSGSSLHEASCTADVLLATSGLYYLMANQQGILAETVYRAFELPIVHELDRYGADVEAERESYAAGMRDASREIRRLEKEGVKLRKPRQRDVGRMRDHLVAMTAALDALTVRQAEHAVTLLDQSRDMSGTVSQASRNLVRAEVDILDSLARKGWPGGGLDVVLDGAVDLFSRNGYDDDDDDDALGGGGGRLLLGGMSNGAGIVGSSSHAVVSGAGGFLGSGVAPKLSLLGGGGGGGGGAPLSSNTLDDDLVDNDADAGDDGGNDDVGIGDDEASEVSTINGNARSSSRATGNDDATASTSGGGGGFFSILTGGSILGRKPDQDQERGRSPTKWQRSSLRSQQSQQSQQSQKSQRSRQSHQSQDAANEGASITEEEEGEDEDEDGDHTLTMSSSQPASASREQQQPRQARADSLAVEPYQHQYQSLDSLAYAEAEAASVTGSDAASIQGRAASASRRKAHQGKLSKPTMTPASSRGRSRPFSPQRVSVDPQDDLFSGQFSSPERTSLAWLKEGEQLDTPQEEKDEKEVGNAEAPADDDAGDERRSQASATNSSADKGKGKAKAESGRTTPTAAASASRASSTRPTPDSKHDETDEGVYIWRHEG